MAAKKSASSESVVIEAPNFQVATFRIAGTAPYVQLRFSEKAKHVMMEAQSAGTTAKSKKKDRDAKDFEALGYAAAHISEDGWYGIPCSAFRNAMISACRVAGLHMTQAKLLVFVEGDGLDKHDQIPLVQLHGPGPVIRVDPVRNATGVIDLRPRPCWTNWHADLRIRYDAGFISLASVAALLMRAGVQVGIGEGRPDSKKSAGMGWGTFEIVETKES